MKTQKPYLAATVENIVSDIIRKKTLPKKETEALSALLDTFKYLYQISKNDEYRKKEDMRDSYAAGAKLAAAFVSSRHGHPSDENITVWFEKYYENNPSEIVVEFQDSDKT